MKNREYKKQWIKMKLEQVIWIITEVKLEEGEINEGMLTEEIYKKIKNHIEEIKKEIEEI